MPQLIVTECPACEAVVGAEILAQYSAVLNPELGATERVTFARCRKCDSPFLLGEEYYGNDKGRDSWSDPYRMFPPRGELVRPTMSRTVRESFREAISCFKGQAYSAATMMCHRAVAAACREHDVNGGGDLSAAIGELRTQGVIETRMLEWAEMLPHLTNRPTIDSHVTRDQARDALEFTDAFLAYVYTFRDRFQEFRNRRRTSTVEPAPVASEPNAFTAAAAGSASRPTTSNGESPLERQA